MTRRIAALLVGLVVVAACSPAEPAPTTTTTIPTDVTGPDGSTTTTSAELPDVSADGFRTRTPGVLVVGTERLTAPWFTGPSPDLTTGGLEYRLGQEIGARLGIPVVKVVATSLVLMMTGQDCGCDIIISGVTITDGRARTLDLTEPYLDSDQALLVRAGTPVPSLTDASLLHLGAGVRNPAAVEVIRNRIKPIVEPLMFVDTDDAVRRLADGRLDGIVLDTPDALAVVKSDPSFAIAGRIRTGDQYAVALSLGSPNTALVNEVIRDMRDDGTVDNLVTSYLGTRPSDVAVLPP